MQTFHNKVAVITGAASGIGLALAQHCAQEGMRVVMADINKKRLLVEAEKLRADGVQVLAIPTDVSKSEQIQALADATLAQFGSVDSLFNNAGVGIATPILKSTGADWAWALGVNLWSIIYGVQVFVPMMQAQGTPCHIVNTASIAGLISAPGLGIYRTTKHAVVAFSEALFHELAAESPHIQVSVLCPGMVKTEILASATRPTAGEAARRDEVEEARLRKAMAIAMPPEEVAQLTFDALRANRFYILTHPERDDQIRGRMDNILNRRNPTNPFLEVS